jgi:glycosyltransferase involved in cell wall biosynthesis
MATAAANGPSAQGDSRRHALIVSLTPVSGEPRVLRQARALHEAGWKVSVAGFRGRGTPPDFWRYIEVDHVLPDRVAWWSSVVQRNLDLMGSRAEKLRSRFRDSAAERSYWSRPGYEGIYQHLAYVDPGDYDLILAHDWFTAPLAERLAEKQGVPYSIDLHEYARGQYMSRRIWRLVDRPWVHAMQKRYLPRAAALTTVCDGIADLIHDEYDLTERPTVVRSVAQYQDLPVRPTGEGVTALYHGILAPARGLEESIASAPLWDPGIRLVIRGPGPASYVAELRNLIERGGVGDRVTVEDPVPAAEMIERANADADIGFFVQPDHSPQKRFALPNKFFEYVTARLALCVSDLPEMARLVREHDLGVLVPEPSPEGIAAALNALDRKAIDRFKRRSDDAAAVLNWDVEKQVMLRLYDRIVPAGSGVGSDEPAPLPAS